jgi:glycosyltransferase involved in cell wall biosynthesis
MDNPRKVLIISYHFPPDAEVGGLRAQKFAKYLPHYGWQPLVLSVLEKYYPQHDKERCHDVTCEIARTRMLLHPRVAYLKIKEAVLRLSGRGRGSQCDSPEPFNNGELELNDRSLPRTKGVILSLLWLPDDRTGWIPPAVLKALNLIRKRNIETVLTTSPPHSVQMIGLILKKLSRRWWVVDLRDPWSLSLDGLQSFPYRMQRWLERKVIQNADVIITATDVVRDGYVKAYPDEPPEKFVCIKNGFDIEDFQRTRSERNTDHTKFVMSYLGDFYAGRSPETFLNALSALTRESVIPIDKLKVRFIGKVRHFGRNSLADIVSELGLSAVTEIMDRVPYMKAIEYMTQSAVLLVLSPQSFYQPTKVFEYMAAGTHMIAFTPAGALADIVNEYPKGKVVAYEDLEGAKKAITYCYEKFLHPEEIGEVKDAETSEILTKYDRRNLTQELSMYL